MVMFLLESVGFLSSYLFDFIYHEGVFLFSTYVFVLFDNLNVKVSTLFLMYHCHLIILNSL